MNKNPHQLSFHTLRGEPHLTLLNQETPPIKFRDLCMALGFSLSQMAITLGVSSSTLRNTFQSYAGITPKSWMSQQRVLIATRMIREGLPFPAITKAMGYHDQSHMNKEFRTVVDCCPKDIRSRLINHQKSA